MKRDFPAKSQPFIISVYLNKGLYFTDVDMSQIAFILNAHSRNHVTLPVQYIVWIFVYVQCSRSVTCNLIGNVRNTKLVPSIPLTMITVLRLLIFMYIPYYSMYDIDVLLNV